MHFARGITTYGDPRNPPIVFLHGIRLGGKIWEEHALALADEYYVVTPDLPGHGALVDLPFEPAVIDAFLAHIGTMLSSRPPLVIGYSLGGYVAMRYATAFPERTCGLLLTGCSTDIVDHRQRLYNFAVAASGQFPPGMLQRMLTAFLRLTCPANVAATIIPFRFDHRVFEASRTIAGGVEYSALLAGYKKPVLLVNGKWDLLFRRDEAKFARRAGAPITVMRRGDHIAPLRHPAEFVAIVRSFAYRVFDAGSTRATGR